MDLSKTKKITKYISSSLFFKMKEWEFLRSLTIRRYGCKCMKCGATNCEMHVDHIKPRKKYPKLQFDPENLQVLCKNCNMEKGFKYKTDYRQKL